jgi:hypothetical protein
MFPGSPIFLQYLSIYIFNRSSCIFFAIFRSFYISTIRPSQITLYLPLIHRYIFYVLLPFITLLSTSSNRTGSFCSIILYMKMILRLSIFILTLLLLFLFCFFSSYMLYFLVLYLLPTTYFFLNRSLPHCKLQTPLDLIRVTCPCDTSCYLLPTTFHHFISLFQDSFLFKIRTNVFDFLI